MKKFLITLLLIAIPSFVFAVPTSVDRVTNFIQPLIRSDFIKATYFVATSTTATSTFAGSLMVGDAMNSGMMTPGGGIINTGQVPFQSSTNINDLTNSVATGNMSQGAYAADCHSQYNASTSPFLGLTATNYFANCFSGPNFNSATAPGGGLIYGSVIPGLPANSYVQAVQPGAMLFGALGTDITKAWMSWSIGSGYQVGNYDMILKNVDTAGSVNTASGGLGLGTTTPDARLTLLASSTATFDYMNVYQHVNGVTTGIPVFNVHKNENVGIASTTPWGRLSVNPNGISGPSFVVGSSTRTSFIVTNGGNVGIGTATPGKKLTVNGPVYVLADLNYGLYLGDPSDASSRPRIVQNGPANIAMYNTFQDNSVSKFSWGYGGVGTTPAYSFFISRTGDFTNPDFLLTPTGITALGLFNNVGIGTTTPWAKFSINPNGIAGPAFVIGSSTKTDFIVTNGGAIGIGTTTTTNAKITVHGSSSATTTVRWGGKKQEEYYNSDGSLVCEFVNGTTQVIQSGACNY